MKIRILGPLCIESSGNNYAPSAHKQRQVLALLLVNPNATVPIPDFIRELWEETPPASAVTTLQTYIMQLRRCVSRALHTDRGQVARDILITTPAGYMFRVPPGAVDVDLYYQRTAAGKRALSTGDYHAATRLLSEALELWQGSPLADVRKGELLQIEARRLDESRLHTTEQLIDVRLSLGHHAQMLEELTYLVAKHPLNENLHAKLMLALYRSGRRSRALEVYGELRAVLISELGLEPCPLVQSMHRAILASDARLDQPRAWDNDPAEIFSSAP